MRDGYLRRKGRFVQSNECRITARKAMRPLRLAMAGAIAPIFHLLHCGAPLRHGKMIANNAMGHCPAAW
jgi:hypothetical protein